MTRDAARDLLVAYLEGELDAAQRTELEKLFTEHAALRRELEQTRTVLRALEAAPPVRADAGMRERFRSTLDREIARQRRPTPLIALPGWVWLGAAAAALMVGIGIGILGGFRLGSGTGATSAQVRDLRRDVERLRAALADPEFVERSGSDRLETIGWAAELTAPEPAVVDALFATIAGDPSPNVRAAAVDALRRFSDRPEIRERLAQELTHQRDPLVQIEIIDVLGHPRDAADRASMQAVLLRGDVSDLVKARAQSQLMDL